jgi:hypothetical protein
MPIVHTNVESSGGTLTDTEWNQAHSISSNSLGLGSSTLYFDEITLYKLGYGTLKTNYDFHIAGDLVVSGTMTGGSGGGFTTTGTATIVPGSVSTAITHSAGGTPDIVCLTPTTDTGGKRWWVDKTSTQFTINIDSIYSSTIKFDWGAAV